MNSNPRSPKKSEIPFRMPERDTQTRVSRSTLTQLAQFRGSTETEVMHYALRRLADEILPAYEIDNGPLTAKQLEAIEELVELPPLGETCSSLFED